IDCADIAEAISYWSLSFIDNSFVDYHFTSAHTDCMVKLLKNNVCHNRSNSVLCRDNGGAL
ncbi:hypothetical protein C9J03_18515, partial [Photobacterium gaetbulicola]|uniref:hypothetical protein n=1 Tax=Photobacterium gaetbulicola TaxID=1295392 RepID=UPI000D46C3EB